MTLFLRKPEACLTRSHLGIISPIGNSCSAYLCGAPSQRGEKQYGDNGEGQASGPRQACSRRVRPLLLSSEHIYKVRYTARRPRDTQSTASPPPRRRGQSGSRGRFFLCNPMPIPGSLKSFPATQEHSGNPDGAEEESDSSLARAGSFK